MCINNTKITAVLFELFSCSIQLITYTKLRFSGSQRVSIRISNLEAVHSKHHTIFAFFRYSPRLARQCLIAFLPNYDVTFLQTKK